MIRTKEITIYDTNEQSLEKEINKFIAAKEIKDQDLVDIKYHSDISISVASALIIFKDGYE